MAKPPLARDTDPGIRVFLDHLTAKGLKVTPQRRSIAEAAFAWHGHFTAEELYQKVKLREPLVGRMTVYRTLGHLVSSGVVHEQVFDKGVAFFEHVFGLPFRSGWKFLRPNAAINVFARESRGWVLETWGDVSHLDGLRAQKN